MLIYPYVLKQTLAIGLPGNIIPIRYSVIMFSPGDCHRIKKRDNDVSSASHRLKFEMEEYDKLCFKIFYLYGLIKEATNKASS